MYPSCNIIIKLSLLLSVNLITIIYSVLLRCKYLNFSELSIALQNKDAQCLLPTY